MEHNDGTFHPKSFKTVPSSLFLSKSYPTIFRLILPHIHREYQISEETFPSSSHEPRQIHQSFTDSDIIDIKNPLKDLLPLQKHKTQQNIVSQTTYAYHKSNKLQNEPQSISQSSASLFIIHIESYPLKISVENVHQTPLIRVTAQ